MSIQQLYLPQSGKDETPARKQIIMILRNIDPVKPVVRFVPEQCARDGWGPFDIDLSTVTGGNAEEVSIRVVILQDNLAFLPGEADVTAGCEVSQKYLRRISPPTRVPARDVEFLVEPLSPDGPELEFNLGLVASGEQLNCKGELVRWSLPVVIDPKIRNLN